MTPLPDSKFLVNPNSDPVAVRVDGKANFKNCATVREFLDQMIEAGKTRFVMDFELCTGMDSTFLGVLAGTAIKLRKMTPRGALVISRLNERNLELVQNLGLTRLLIVDDGAECKTSDDDALDCDPVTDQIAAAREVIEAHRNLIVADAANEEKFRDVLAFMQQQANQQ